MEECFDGIIIITKQGGDAFISGGIVPDAPTLSLTSPPVGNIVVLPSLLSSVAASALINVGMISMDPLLKDLPPTANHVTPLVSNQSVLSLEEKI